MTSLDNVVAGISCREVLADLSDFMDGDLPERRILQLRAHVAECSACAQFGHSVAAALDALRAGTAAPELPSGASERLRARLARERGPGATA